MNSVDKLCENLHYELINGMYFNGEKEISNALVVWSKCIDDNFWNYATRIDTDNMSKTIKDTSNFLITKNRAPAFYITPFCKPDDIKKILKKQGFEKVFSDAWMFYNGKMNKSNHDTSIKLVENKNDMDKFIKIYSDGFSEGVYSFAKEYEQAVLESFENQSNGIIASNYIGFCNDEPATVISLIQKDQYCGVYNLATANSHKNKGLGSKILTYSVGQALKNGAKEIFLQTEKNSYNEEFYTKRGFSTHFAADCFAKK